MKRDHLRNHFLIILSLALVWASVSLFLYSFYFQISSIFSLRRLAYSAGVGAVPAVAYVLLLYIKPGLLQRLNRKAVTRSFLIALGLCFFLFLWNIPTDLTLFAPVTDLKVEVKAANVEGGNIKIIWLYSGLGDISPSAVKLSSGSSYDQSGISLEFDQKGKASLEWKGRAWKQIKVVFASHPDMTVTVQTSPGGVAVYQVMAEAVSQKVILVPVLGEWYYLLLSLVLIAVTLFSTLSIITLAGWLPFRPFLIWLEEKIKISLSPRTVWILIGSVFIIITAVIIIIAFNNRLYSDDYCYAVKLRQYGFGGAILNSFQTLNGRLMSHFFDYIAQSLGKLSVPLGPIFILLGVGSSLFFLISQLLVGKNKNARYGMAALISLIILVLTFLIAPDIYESIYWTLHALILTGGLAAFNVTLGLLVRNMHNQVEAKGQFGISLLFLALGFAGSLFNEAISIFMIAFFGMLLAGLILRWKILLRINLPAKPIASFLVGAIGGLIIIVFSPGNTQRFSKLGLSLNMADKYSVYLSLIRNNLTTMFLENHASGILILAVAIILGYGCGWFMLQSLKFKEQSLNDLEKFIIWLMPFILTLLIFVPSIFIGSYFPKRTLYIPLYFTLLLYFIFAMYLGSLSRSSQLGRRSLSILLAVSVLILGVTSLIRLDNIYRQMRLFSAEWDAREVTIQQVLKSGQKEIQVQPFKYSFGTDISTLSNSWFTPCLDDYYGLNFTVEDGK
jgi:hypothetical protein